MEFNVRSALNVVRLMPCWLVEAPTSHEGRIEMCKIKFLQVDFPHSTDRYMPDDIYLIMTYNFYYAVVA